MNTLAREQFKPEFLKMNPQHCVPTLDDNGLVLWEGPAIITYLATKYAAKDVELVPNDVYLRGKLDQRLHFNNGTLLGRYLQLIIPIFSGTVHELNAEQVVGVRESLDFLEAFLQDDDYLVGNKLSVADFSNVTTAVTILQIIEIDAAKYPKMLAWIERISKLSYYDDAKNAALFKEAFTGRLNANKLLAGK